MLTEGMFGCLSDGLPQIRSGDTARDHRHLYLGDRAPAQMQEDKCLCVLVQVRDDRRELFYVEVDDSSGQRALLYTERLGVDKHNRLRKASGEQCWDAQCQRRITASASGVVVLVARRPLGWMCNLANVVEGLGVAPCGESTAVRVMGPRAERGLRPNTSFSVSRARVSARWLS